MSVAQDALNTMYEYQQAVQTGSVIEERAFQLAIVNSVIVCLENVAGQTPSSDSAPGDPTAPVNDPVQVENPSGN